MQNLNKIVFDFLKIFGIWWMIFVNADKLKSIYMINKSFFQAIAILINVNNKEKRKKLNTRAKIMTSNYLRL